MKKFLLLLFALIAAFGIGVYMDFLVQPQSAHSGTIPSQQAAGSMPSPTLQVPISVTGFTNEQAQDQYYWQNRLNCSSQEAHAIVQQIDEVARTYGFSYAETTKRVEYLRINSLGMGIQEAIDYTRVALDGLRKTGHDTTELIAKIYLPPDVQSDMKRELSELDKEMKKLHETE